MKLTIQYSFGAMVAVALAGSSGAQVAPAMTPSTPVVSPTQELRPAMAEGQNGQEPTTVVPLPQRTLRPAMGAADLPGVPAAGYPAGLQSSGMADGISLDGSANVQRLQAFSDSEIKFNIGDLMRILRDSRHEGWVLAAYPDPKTGHPLIGAGFTLDLPPRTHPQTDPMNPHPFMEPSSVELWQAAGLDMSRLRGILSQFDTRFAAWNKKGFRRKMTILAPQISDEDAAQLLRVAIIQSAYNAKGYCRDFDRITASQQMALTQLVYQMGYNLQEFDKFLALINNYASRTEVAGAEGTATAVAAMHSDFAMDKEYWKTVQQSLVSSQWARLYRTRAVAVIAMLDPQYGSAPMAAESRVGAMLRPAVVRKTRHGRAGVPQRRAVGKTSRGRASRQRKRGV